MTEFKKHRSVNILLSPKTRCFKNAPTTKNKVCPQMTLLQNAGLHKRATYSKTLHCDGDLGLVTSTNPGVGAWRWCLCLGSGWGWSLVWCLGWLASAKPPGHGISQSFHTNVLEEVVFEASRAATAHEISNPSVRKFQKDSFWRLREGMRPREFPTFPSESVARIRF